MAALGTLSIGSVASAAQNACPPTINSCGCVITAPGAYKLGLAITSKQGLNPSGACLEIASSFITLDGAKKNITGAGGSSPRGIGILVRRGVKTTLLEGRGSVVSGWNVGLLIQSTDSVVDNFAANDNGIAGVELNKAQGVSLSNITATDNLNYGVWLRQSNFNLVSNPKTQTNGNIGTYVGCANIGPTGGSCPGVGASSGNYIFTGNEASNVNYGIALDVSARTAIVTDNSLKGGTPNGKFDFFDANSNCGTDQWFGNDSTATTSPNTCVK